MKKIALTFLGILGLGLFVVIILFATSVFQGSKEDISDVNNTAFRKGVSYSPKSLTKSEDILDFWERAKETGTVIRTGGDWIDFHEEGEIAEVVVELSRRNDLIPVVEVNFFNQDTGELLRPLNERNKDAYKEAAVDFARRYKPPYFGIGVEIDTFERENSEEFDNFAALFSEAYDAIKEVSPETQVFTTFQYERLIGLRGGLFGGENDTSAADWQLLDKFPKADFISFTTYPGLIFKDPANIPSDYYSRIKDHTSKPVAFTEIGWRSNKAIKGWESSEEEQARFVGRFFDLTSNLDMRLAVWAFVYPQLETEPFASMSLRSLDGSPKRSWNAWVEATR